MIEPDWKRMAGIHFEDEGTAGAVWLAHDRHSDVTHLYDACLFNREVFVIIAEGLAARGRWLPIAWERKQKALRDKLYERGCNMIQEGFEDSDAMSEAMARDIDEMLRTQRLRINKRLRSWLDEYQSLTRKDNKIPRQGFPLMSATRYAVGMFDEWARPEKMVDFGSNAYPEVVTV